MSNYSATYDGNEPFLFISYARNDSEIVLPLIEGLQVRGFRVWYDKQISDGEQWQRVIAENIKKSRCVIAFISRASLNSPNCRKEINYAVNLSERYGDTHAAPIPVYLDDTEMDAEMEMVLMPLQSRYYDRYSGPEEFLDSLEASDTLQICRQPKTEEWDTISFADSADTDFPDTPEGWHRRSEKLGMEDKLEEAAAWCRKAAEHGYAPAQYSLGLSYDLGDGVPEDSVEAAKWYCMAAEQGHVEAMFELGCCYDNGRGVPQNMTEALRWYQKAAEQGHAEGQFNLGCAYFYGDGVFQNYTEAVKWFRAAAEQGYADAQLNLALCYEFGMGVPLDKTEAATWFRMAAEQGQVLAQRNLGLCYEEGEGYRQDLQEALKWYYRAKANGHDTVDEDIARCEAKLQ